MTRMTTIFASGADAILTGTALRAACEDRTTMPLRRAALGVRRLERKQPRSWAPSSPYSFFVPRDSIRRLADRGDQAQREQRENEEAIQRAARQNCSQTFLSSMPTWLFSNARAAEAISQIQQRGP